MTYPSEIKQKTKKENKKKIFNELALLYLKSKTINEYKIARNLKYPNISNFTDCFIWWYFFKENEKSIKYFSLILIILSTISTIIMFIISNFSFYIPLSISLLIVFIHIFIGIFIEYFGKLNIYSENGCRSFRYYDQNGIK